MINWKRISLFALICFLLVLPNGIVYGQNLPDSAHVSGIVGHAQTYGLSCESRSAVDWAAFWGVDISEWEFLSRLPVTDNPDKGFVGYYNGVWGAIPPASYGVHAKPVASLLQKYGLNAKARKGLSWDDLRAEIAGGRPVIVWIIGQMWSGTPIKYTASNGHKTTVAAYEHTMIFIGYDSTYVYLIDASSGATMTYYTSTFYDSWSVLGNMAVTGQGRVKKLTATVQAPKPAPSNHTSQSGGNYTVQRGDYLINLAEQYGTSWQELARINAIPYPYAIYPGQVLLLSEQPVIPAYQLYFPLLTRKVRANR